MGRHALIAALMLVACGIAANVSAASPAGDLDPSFDGDGRFVLGQGTGAAVLVQDDGKIVLAGLVGGGASRDFRVARLNPDGSRDTGFDGDGTATVDFGGGDAAFGAALQRDGKIVVAGAAETGGDPSAAAVARLNGDGSLDATFDPGGLDGAGKKIIPDGDDARAVLVQEDGRIVLAGQAGTDMTAWRLNPDGSLDGTSFERADLGGNEHAEAMAVQGDGRIIVAGVTSTSIGVRGAVARFDAGGRLDATFGNAGKTTTGRSDSAVAHDVLVQPDGRIVLAGLDGPQPGADFAVTRLNPDASPDTTFAGTGTATTDFGQTNDGAHAVALQPDGKIVAAGASGRGFPEDSSYDFAAVRYVPDGGLDPMFGLAGKATFSLGGIDVATAAALQPDGRIVLAGTSAVTGTPGATLVALARLQADPPPSEAPAPAPEAAPPPPPARPAPAAPAAKPARIRAAVVARWAVRGPRTRVRSLVVTRVPRGGAVTLRCSRRCAFKSRTIRKSGRVRLTALFKRRALSAGTILEIRVTAPGAIGHFKRYRVRKGKRPSKQTRCLRPGTTRPAIRCA